MGEIQFNNLQLEAAIMAGPLHIDFDFAISCLASYQNDLLQRKAGFSVFEIGLSERRKASELFILSPLSAGFDTISDPKLINNERLTVPGSIAVLKLSGFMQTESGLSNPGVTELANNLRAAYSNNNISSVILEINSGGGQSTAGEILRTAITERNKPVLAYGWMVASAAYDAASATDEIISSSNSARFGSIGAMYSINKMVLEAMKASTLDIYGATAPNKNAAERKAIEGDFSGIQKLADEFTQNFQDSVRDFRNLKGSENKIKETLDGSMFFAQDAKSRGLVDSIGNFNFAISRAKRWEKMK